MERFVEPTEEEKRNGWTKETLTEYILERKISQAEENTLRAMLIIPKKYSIENETEYNPHKW